MSQQNPRPQPQPQPQPGPQPAPSAPSGSGSISVSGPSGSGPAPTSSGIVIPPTAAAGVLSFTEPVQTLTSFYKIAPGALVTFGWKFSDVLVAPTSLTFSAVCAENGNTYPIGPTDGIVPGSATELVWDPYSYHTSHPNLPLAQGNYNLKVWDGSPDAPRRGGYLTPNTGLKFGMYFPQQYTGLSDGWSCPNCNGSYSSYVAHPAFAALVATVLVVFLSGFSLMRQARA